MNVCVCIYVLPCATGVDAEEAVPLMVVLLLDALAPDGTTETQNIQVYFTSLKFLVSKFFF